MKSLPEFEIIYTKQKIVIFSLPFEGDSSESSPLALYDGSDKLMLYKSSNNVLCLEFGPQVSNWLQSADYFQILEFDYNKE